MKINLHIERLVLDGVPIDRTQGGKVRAAVEQELTRLLTAGGLGPQLAAGGAIPRLRGGKIKISPQHAAGEVSSQIANAVYQGIGTPGSAPSRTKAPESRPGAHANVQAHQRQITGIHVPHQEPVTR